MHHRCIFDRYRFYISGVVVFFWKAVVFIWKHQIIIMYSIAWIYCLLVKLLLFKRKQQLQKNKVDPDQKYLLDAYIFFSFTIISSLFDKNITSAMKQIKSVTSDVSLLSGTVFLIYNFNLSTNFNKVFITRCFGV